MTVKLIAVDMDGTALHTDKSISERTITALQEAARQGCVVLPATGRIVKMLPKPITSIPGIRFAITSNGASVIDFRNRSTVYSDLMTTDETNRIVPFLCGTGFLVEAYCGGISYSDKEALQRLLRLNPPELILGLVMQSQTFVENLPEFIASHNLRLEKINMPYIPDEFRRQLFLQLSEKKEYSVCSSCPTNIEVNTATCSKGNALRYLCSKLKISPSQVMAIGDSGNDVSMLEYAGFAVAMGNADPPLRESADYITGTNDEDGVAYAVEKFVLKN